MQVSPSRIQNIEVIYALGSKKHHLRRSLYSSRIPLTYTSQRGYSIKAHGNRAFPSTRASRIDKMFLYKRYGVRVKNNQGILVKSSRRIQPTRTLSRRNRRVKVVCGLYRDMHIPEFYISRIYMRVLSNNPKYVWCVSYTEYAITETKLINVAGNSLPVQRMFHRNT